MPKSVKRRPVASKRAARKPRQTKAGAITPAKTRPNTKQSRVITLLRSENGASIPALMEATGWQQHSVRGFFASVVRKRLKLKLESKKIDGFRIYRIVGGSGRAAKT